jgi:hypothetical protein
LGCEFTPREQMSPDAATITNYKPVDKPSPQSSDKTPL